MNEVNVVVRKYAYTPRGDDVPVDDGLVDWVVDCVVTYGGTTISGAEIVAASPDSSVEDLVSIIRDRYK